MSGPNDNFPRLFGADDAAAVEPTSLWSKSGTLIHSAITTRTVQTLPIGMQPRTGRDLVSISGNGMLDFESQLTISGPGQFQFDGSSSSVPIALLRVSRNAAGSSINNSYMGNCLFSGDSLIAHFINDGQELMLVQNCHFVQDRNEGCCVELSNRDRTVPLDGFADATARWFATTAGLIFHNCSFAVEGTVGASSVTGGASIRIRGNVTYALFDRCWFAGNAPIRIIDEADETWTSPPAPGAGGTTNTPAQIKLRDCIAEGAGEVTKVRRYSVNAAEILLEGWSASFFTIVNGDA